MNAVNSATEFQNCEFPNGEYRHSIMNALWNLLFGGLMITLSTAMFRTLTDANLLIAAAVGLYGLWNVLHALSLIFDQRIQIQFDEQGIHGRRLGREIIRWNKLLSAQIYHKPIGIRSTVHLRLVTNDGRIHDLQISQLDAGLRELLTTFDQFRSQSIPEA